MRNFLCNNIKHSRAIRRVSLDKFYELVTGEADAFYQICVVLPEVIDEVIASMGFRREMGCSADFMSMLQGLENNAGF